MPRRTNSANFALGALRKIGKANRISVRSSPAYEVAADALVDLHTAVTFGGEALSDLTWRQVNKRSLQQRRATVLQATLELEMDRDHHRHLVDAVTDVAEANLVSSACAAFMQTTALDANSARHRSWRKRKWRRYDDDWSTHPCWDECDERPSAVRAKWDGMPSSYGPPPVVAPPKPDVVPWPMDASASTTCYPVEKASSSTMRSSAPDFVPGAGDDRPLEPTLNDEFAMLRSCLADLSSDLEGKRQAIYQRFDDVRFREVDLFKRVFELEMASQDASRRMLDLEQLAAISRGTLDDVAEESRELEAKLVRAAAISDEKIAEIDDYVNDGLGPFIENSIDERCQTKYDQLIGQLDASIAAVFKSINTGTEFIEQRFELMSSQFDAKISSLLANVLGAERPLVTHITDEEDACSAGLDGLDGSLVGEGPPGDPRMSFPEMLATECAEDMCGTDEDSMSIVDMLETCAPDDLVEEYVCVRGLVRNPELNGRIGQIVGFQATTDRFEVIFASQGKPIAIKPANLWEAASPLFVVCGVCQNGDVTNVREPCPFCDASPEERLVLASDELRNWA